MWTLITTWFTIFSKSILWMLKQLVSSWKQWDRWRSPLINHSHIMLSACVTRQLLDITALSWAGHLPWQTSSHGVEPSASFAVSLKPDDESGPCRLVKVTQRYQLVWLATISQFIISASVKNSYVHIDSRFQAVRITQRRELDWQISGLL